MDVWACQNSTFMLMWTEECVAILIMLIKLISSFLPHQLLLPALFETETQTLRLTIPTGQMSSVKAQPLRDMLQERSINHSPQEGSWQAQTRIRRLRFTPHIEAQARNLDHQVIFKLVIDPPITKWIIHCQHRLGTTFTVAAACVAADIQPGDRLLSSDQERTSKVK